MGIDMQIKNVSRNANRIANSNAEPLPPQLPYHLPNTYQDCPTCPCTISPPKLRFGTGPKVARALFVPKGTLWNRAQHGTSTFRPKTTVLVPVYASKCLPPALPDIGPRAIGTHFGGPGLGGSQRGSGTHF